MSETTPVWQLRLLILITAATLGVLIGLAL